MDNSIQNKSSKILNVNHSSIASKENLSPEVGH